MQGTGYTPAPPLSPPPKTAPTLKLRINPSPKTSPAAPPSVRLAPQQPHPIHPPYQQSPSSHPGGSQAASHADVDSVLQPQQAQQHKLLSSGAAAAAAQHEAPRQQETGKQAHLPQQLQDESQQQLEQRQGGPKLKKQKREVAQGEQPQLSGGRPSLKVKLGGALKVGQHMQGIVVPAD